jgi:hypothetical protein
MPPMWSAAQALLPTLSEAAIDQNVSGSRRPAARRSKCFREGSFNNVIVVHAEKQS